MQDLKHSLEEAASQSDSDAKIKLYPELQEAAEKWGVHSLRCYQGEALNRALAISRAIVDFVEEISKDVS